MYVMMIIAYSITSRTMYYTVSDNAYVHLGLGTRLLAMCVCACVSVNCMHMNVYNTMLQTNYCAVKYMQHAVVYPEWVLRVLEHPPWP